MRIIAGLYRNRKLLAPKGNLTRPSMSQTRESMFHLITSRMRLENADVLDLFAGTGSLGFEAVSRGAAAVTFVELDGRVLKVTRQNALNLGVEQYCTILKADVFRYLAQPKGPPFDLILADPPYQENIFERFPELAFSRLNPGGLFVLEHDRRISYKDTVGLDTTRSYGRSQVSIFIKPAVTESILEENGG